MDDTKTPPLDYQQAAERLLVALSFIATRIPDHPVPAVQVCAHVFDKKLRAHWSHETRRRRIRDTVVEARKLLAQQSSSASPAGVGGAGATLVANGQGYWITGDRQIIAWYAAKRRRHGLKQLAAGSQAKKQLAAQDSLFPAPETPSPSAWRH